MQAANPTMRIEINKTTSIAYHLLDRDNGGMKESEECIM